MLSYFEKVRFAFLTILVVCAGSIALGQSQSTASPRPSPEPSVDLQNTIVDPNITQADIARLPLNKTWARPRLTMQRALKIAERYARSQRVRISSYFLLEARMIEYGGDQAPRELRWFFRWGAPKRLPVEITVSMFGKPSRSPSM